MVSFRSEFLTATVFFQKLDVNLLKKSFYMLQISTLIHFNEKNLNLLKIENQKFTYSKLRSGVAVHLNYERNISKSDAKFRHLENMDSHALNCEIGN